MSEDRRERRDEERRQGRDGRSPRGQGAEGRGGHRGRDERPRRDDREGGYRGRDERPRRDDREGGYRGRDERPRRDDRVGGYRGRDARPRRDDRDGGYRGRDERSGGGYRGREYREGQDRPRRQPEPEIPEDIEAGQLDKSLRAELLTLSKDNAEGTARHLVAVGRALDEEDFDAALAHAQAASKRAGRVAGVRETLGVVHYRRGEWAKALAEFRTARRLSGMDHLLPLMADAERGLGRPERALELAASPEAARLAPAEIIEMAIVVSGARTDMGQTAAAVQHLRELARAGSPKAPWAARLRYAYAAALEADGRAEEAEEWFRKAAELDPSGLTDAAEVLGLGDEPEFVDLVDLDEQDDPDGRDTGRDRRDVAGDDEQGGA